VVRRRYRLLVVAFALAGLAGFVPATAVAEEEPPTIDDGPAPAHLLDPDLLPFEHRNGKIVEQINPDGSDGFLPFRPRSFAYGAYRFQLVASGSDGNIETLRTAIAGAAAQLTTITNIQFSVDPGQVPRPSDVQRFSQGCGPSNARASGFQCSLFGDTDETVGVIRITLSNGSPCGPLVSSSTTHGTIGCGGPESVELGGTTYHLRGNVWLSPSVQGANAGLAPVVIAHEIGHAIGLDHFDGRFTLLGGEPVRQLMNSGVHDDPSDTGLLYRSGDALGVLWLHPEEAWYITATYRDFLGRIPDTAGYQFWIGQDISIDDYVTSLASSDEWVGQIVNDFYADVFGRPADPGGFAFWTSQVRQRGVPFVAAQLYGSAEYLNANGGSDTGFVQAMYRQLLGRDPNADPAGVSFWVGEARRRGRVEVAFAFFQSEEKRRGRVRDLYCTLLDRTPDAGGSAYWAGVILREGDLALARNLATSTEYRSKADDFALQDPSTPPAPGCA
jgi:hypothetical protein